MDSVFMQRAMSGSLPVKVVGGTPIEPHIPAPAVLSAPWSDAHSYFGGEGIVLVSAADIDPATDLIEARLNAAFDGVFAAV